MVPRTLVEMLFESPDQVFRGPKLTTYFLGALSSVSNLMNRFRFITQWLHQASEHLQLTGEQ